jgi:hypothetical protein
MLSHMMDGRPDAFSIHLGRRSTLDKANDMGLTGLVMFHFGLKELRPSLPLAGDRDPNQDDRRRSKLTQNAAQSLRNGPRPALA